MKQVDLKEKLKNTVPNGAKLDQTNINEIGKRIRAVLNPGVILNLSGPMGVGKTTLIKHILPEYEVNSPSFLHALLYGEKFAHIDAYTIKSEEALFGLDLPKMLEDRCLIIEWGSLFKEYLNQLDAQIIEIELVYSDNFHENEDYERFIFIK